MYSGKWPDIFGCYHIPIIKINPTKNDKVILQFSEIHSGKAENYVQFLNKFVMTDACYVHVYMM